MIRKESKHDEIMLPIIKIMKGSLGIATTFIKLDSRSPRLGFIPVIFTKGINQIKKGKLYEKVRFYAYKKI